MTRNTANWSLVITPNRVAALLALTLAWLFCALVAWMLYFTFAPDTPGWIAWAPVAPFALVITYYGLKTLLVRSGTITLTEEGFTVSDVKHDRVRRRWDEIEMFFLDTTFSSPVYDGKEAPHFRLKADSSVGWLPQNGGHTAAELVLIMEAARRLAAAGWPVRPGRVSELRKSAQSVESPALQEVRH